jgi:hypothetical protein
VRRSSGMRRSSRLITDEYGRIMTRAHGRVRLVKAQLRRSPPRGRRHLAAGRASGGVEPGRPGLARFSRPAEVAPPSRSPVMRRNPPPPPRPIPCRG